MAKATSGSDAQFTYDFGIAIAQSTINKVTRLTGVTLSLASAYYALKTTAEEYVNTLRENTFRFGGMLGTMQAMEQAQNRLIKGLTYFNVDDQLRGMNQLMAVGVDMRKNLDWITKAAHASGQSLAQFSGAIANAISGNMGQLVDMGLITQRATRMFDKYAANTVMRQQAILNFVKNHKGLLAAIRNDFYTIQDQMNRIKATWSAFLQSILGKPNDPSSFYGQIARSMKLVADALANNLEQIRRVGFVIGSVLGWVMKQVGHFVVWIGKKMKQSLSAVWKMTDNYKEFTRSLLVWLEFWKLKVVDFFKEYGGAIKTVLKLVLAYKALKWAFLIGDVIIKSVWAYYKAIKDIVKLQMAYIAFQGPALNKIAVWLQSLAVWLPQPFRHAWVASGKYLGKMVANCKTSTGIIGTMFRAIPKVVAAPLLATITLLKTGLKGIVGLIGTVLTGPFALLTKGRFGGGLFSKSLKALVAPLRLLGKILIWILTPFAKLREGFVWLGANAGRLFMGLFGTLKTIGASILNFLFNIGGITKTFFNLLKLRGVAAIRAISLAISSINPFGWIVIAITAIVVLYKKFAIVRTVVNQMFKTWWEWIKLLWNLAYGAVIGVMVVFKNLWNYISGFFKWAARAIKNMWNGFKDTSVGRFVDRYIVIPLRTLFEWIMDGIRWLLKGAATILSVINSDLAEQIRKGEKALGIKGSLALSGGTYDFNDSTDYLSPDNWNLGRVPALGLSTPNMDIPRSNPISDAMGLGNTPLSSGGSTTNNNLSFSNGAIQIIVQKGEHIDEQKLARLVRETIKDTNRSSNIRGGLV